MTSKTTPSDHDFVFALHLVETAVFLELPLFQIREKNLPVRILYELVSRAAEITRGTSTRLLVNDRLDVARAAGADGVHLTESSMPPRVVRETCGEEFLIGVSTHSLESARAARDGGADFVVFGPVFETESKRAYGPPQGLAKLRDVATALAGFPVLAIGGITIDNAESCFEAGASGVAGISWFNRPD
ncbi:MAG TPA: thiamine phosphate synthase [Pyrinomonadaceae bacterium]|jgi:thiamine-phosphate pyrophosphorylase|nr:thiamine phosphate synthase [Pyrinomonadaceae bacterium]